MEDESKTVVLLKKKIQAIVKENWKSKKVPAFTERQRKYEGEDFQILQSAS